MSQNNELDDVLKMKIFGNGNKNIYTERGFSAHFGVSKYEALKIFQHINNKLKFEFDIKDFLSCLYFLKVYPTDDNAILFVPYESKTQYKRKLNQTISVLYRYLKSFVCMKNIKSCFHFS